MQQDVPFALLAAVGLVGVAAWLGLAATATPGVRRAPWNRGSLPLVLGCLVLAFTDGWTAGQIGAGVASDVLAGARAVGGLLLAGGLFAGALRADHLRREGEPAGRLLSVAPVGAALGPAVVAALALGAAAVAALRGRSLGRLPLAVSLAVQGCAELAAPAASSSAHGAVVLLGLRLAGLLVLLVAVGRLLRASLLAKVVGAIMAAILAASVAAAAIVGTVVTRSLLQREAAQVGAAAAGLSTDVSNQETIALSYAGFVAACVDDTALCQIVVDRFAATAAGTVFAATVRPAAEGPAVQVFAPMPNAKKATTPTAAALASLPLIRDALAGRSTPGVGSVVAPGLAHLVVLPGPPGSAPRLAVLGLVPSSTVSGAGVGPPRALGVYGSVFDASALGLEQDRTGLEVTALSIRAAPLVLGSTLKATQEAGGGSLADGLAATLPAPRLLRPNKVVVDTASGALPSRAYVVPANDPTVAFVLSTPANAVDKNQRSALLDLYVALLGIAAVTVGLALALGRQVVEPVRALTGVALAVRSGDLASRSRQAGPDEVGTLARAVDEMTSSLLAATDVARNIAETETALRARMETVLARMTDGLVVVDRFGLIDTVNAAACAALGLNARQVVGRDLVEALPLAGPVVEGLAVEDPQDQPGAEDRPAVTEADGVLTRPDGTLVPVSLSASPLPSGGWVVLLRDRTRERQVERMKTEFLANVSHELRTPLTPIRGYADLLSRKPDLGPEKVRQFAVAMNDSTLRLNRVVNLLVDVAALDAGRVASVPEPVAPGVFVQSRIDAAQATTPARAADLRRRVAAGLPRVVLDPDLIGKAIDELVDNALKFSEPGTPVTIQASLGPAGGVRFSVHDAGAGLDAEGMAAFHADFVQADGSATRTREGLGLGLGYVRRVVGALGLRLEVDSAPGRGTSVHIDVPRSASLVAPRRSPEGRSALRP